MSSVFLNHSALLQVLGNGDLYLMNVNDSLSSTLHDALDMVRRADPAVPSVEGHLGGLLPLSRSSLFFEG